jgi:hypothetical protein
MQVVRMSLIVDKIQRYHKNGVVSLKDLKSYNYHLYKYVYRNVEKVDKELYDTYGVEVLNDMIPIQDHNVLLYLKYHFGFTINLSELRKHQTVYREILKMGYTIDEFMDKYHLELIRNDISEGKLINELQKHVDNDDYLLPLSKRLNNCISYRAKLAGLSPADYLSQYGLKRRC